ncbi:hypothetical protein AB0O67_01185 [Streptomyces sp. NPDC086077]|uniref:hypothetical protein n=1 Tax=Streptomyces sp. NPDC086077 TaxID=3154862 RepID=UPI003445E374
MTETRAIWSGSFERMGIGVGNLAGYYNYADAILILFTTLERLQAHGPRAAVWWRCRYWTVPVDVESRRPVDLLPDREASSPAA